MAMTLRKADLSDVDAIVELWKGMMELHQRSDDYYAMDTDAENAYRKYAGENIENGRKYMEIIEMAVRLEEKRIQGVSRKSCVGNDARWVAINPACPISFS